MGQLLDEISSSELVEWLVIFEHEDAEHAKQLADAERAAKR